MRSEQFAAIQELHIPIHNKKYDKPGVHITCAECNKAWPCHVQSLLTFIDESFGDALKTKFEDYNDS